jgi:hypothetical protein
MNAKRLSITIVASALLGMTLAPGLAGAEQGFDAGGSGDRLAHYQMIKQVIIPPAKDVVVDYETMKFLEDNLLGIHSPDAQFTQLDTADTVDADAIVDYETMKFLEDNLLGIHSPNAQFTQLDTAGTIEANAAPCQGEGLVSDAQARNEVAGSIANYCTGEAFADSLGTRSDTVAPEVRLYLDPPSPFGPLEY